MHKKAAYELAIGYTLRSLQSDRKASRDRLAKALEIDELAVTRIETGEERMSAGDLVLMLEHFNIGWDDFLSRVKANLPAAESAITKR
ncbi:MAG: hypothetical protein R3D44_16930 [Hyphomicrobiaceae bacterium]